MLELETVTGLTRRRGSMVGGIVGWGLLVGGAYLLQEQVPYQDRKSRPKPVSSSLKSYAFDLIFGIRTQISSLMESPF